MKLFDILMGISFKVLHGKLSQMEINDLIFDSRTVNRGDVFVCIDGANYDSHRDIDKICDKGASVIFVQKDVETTRDILILKVVSTRKVLSYLSINYFSLPHKKLTMIAVTGTKGKTSTICMLNKLLTSLGHTCGMIGTFGASYKSHHIETENTTPNPYKIQYLLKTMLDDGVDTVIMEISSHSLALDWVTGIEFDIAILTNILPNIIATRQFNSMENYLKYKNNLFKKCQLAVVNGDDKYVEEILYNTSCDVVTFGLTSEVDYRADNIRLNTNTLGITYDFYGKKKSIININHIGRQNVYNSLAAFTVLKLLGGSISTSKKLLENVVISGSAEIIPNAYSLAIIADNARLYVEIQSLFEMVSEYKKNRIITVFTHSSIDQGIISLLKKYSDISVITSVLFDTKIEDEALVHISDSVLAINYAISIANTDDIVLIIDKGYIDKYEAIATALSLKGNNKNC